MAEDEGKGLVRIDGLIRRNANTNLGDKVGVNKAYVYPAEEVTLVPIISEGHKISFDQGIENFVKRGLLRRPVVKGDVVIVPGIALMAGALPFMVIRTKPDGDVRIAGETTITLREATFRESEILSPEDLFRAVADRVSDVMDEFGGKLSELAGETGERARSISKKLLEIIEELREKQDQGE